MPVTVYTGNIGPIRGLCPRADVKGSLPRTERASIDTSNTIALFQGSVVYLVAGKIRGLPASATTPGATCKGCIVSLFDLYGRAITNIASSTGGFAEYTTDPNQVYEITVDDTSFAATDAGKMYNFAAEAGTVGTILPGMSGSGASTIQLKGSTENADTRYFIAQGLVTGQFNNQAAVAGTLVYGVINPTYFQFGSA